MKYTGGCHCGAVTYEAEMELIKAITCNCSHCSKKGFILAFIPADQFTLFSGEDNLTLYEFNKKMIQHLFCKTCGVESFARGKGQEGTPTAMINVRCLDNIDLNLLQISEFNGSDL